MEDMHFDVRVGVEKVVVIELQYPGLNKIEGFTAIIHMRLWEKYPVTNTNLSIIVSR